MNRTFRVTAVFVGLLCLWARDAGAQATAPPAQFDIVGYIQEATLDGTVAGTATTPRLNTDLRAGGTMTVNGIKILVPNNTILQMPATSFTWAQLFDPANSAKLPGNVMHQIQGQTMLALADIPTPRLPPLRLPLEPTFPAFAVHVVGNVVANPVFGGAPRYIAGLILPITQQDLNSGQGIVNYIDYATGRFRVGGQIGNANSGALVEINDPVGRWGKVHSPDPRFTTDTGNPTVHAATGFPMGIPRVAPPAIDPLCPLTNRPLNNNGAFGPADPFLAPTAPRRFFDMPAPGAPGSTTDPRKQAPIMVGDWVDYSGTLCKINPAGPNLPVNMFISAHTLDVNVGIYTAPGIQPCYITIEFSEMGTNAAPIGGIAQEATNRLRVEGCTTDPSQLIDIYAIDVDPVTGAETLRLLGTEDPNLLAVRGRFKHIVNKGGVFGALTRDMIVKSRTGQTPNVANGLTAGQYRWPQFGFIFPEITRFGDPVVPNNFQDIPFLARGSGPLNGTGPVVGQLDPWPGDLAPLP